MKLEHTFQKRMHLCTCTYRFVTLSSMVAMGAHAVRAHAVMYNSWQKSVFFS